VYIYISARTLGQAFDEVKDLVRGTIVADIKDLWDCYQHFKKLKGVRVFEVKSLGKMNLLQNVTVNFIFEERFVGEM